LPTNNLPAAVAEELIFISPENLEPLQTRAKEGDAEAMLELARRHETGWGVRWNPTAAFKWAEDAAEKNEPRARVLLAFYCMSRTGTNRVDVQRAAQLEETGVANGARSWFGKWPTRAMLLH
jgi:TPR repeat protein